MLAATLVRRGDGKDNQVVVLPAEFDARCSSLSLPRGEDDGLARSEQRLDTDRKTLLLSKPPVELPELKTWLLWHASYDTDPAHIWLRNTIVRVASQQRKAKTVTARKAR